MFIFLIMANALVGLNCSIGFSHGDFQVTFVFIKFNYYDTYKIISKQKITFKFTLHYH